MRLVPIPDSWKVLLDGKNLAIEDNPTTLPDPENILRALEETPLDSVKVVILGQDPYIQKGVANGLAFAVNKGLPRPPTLRNIIKEVEADLGIEVDRNASTLLGWARQGVLLLNTALTVEQGRSGSHVDRWHEWTKGLFKGVVDNRSNVVFMLWGAQAESFKTMIHYGHFAPLIAAHPSPQAGGAFFGCKHFSKANQLLKSIGKEPIDWSRIDAED